MKTYQMKLTANEIAKLVSGLSQSILHFTSTGVDEERLARLNYFAKRLIKIQKGDDTEENAETPISSPWPKV